MGDNVFDPPFDGIDLCIKHVLKIIIHDLNIGRNCLFLARADLGFEPLAHINKLPSPCRQGSENTQILIWQLSPNLRSECHEPCDEFRIDPICLCSRAPR